MKKFNIYVGKFPPLKVDSSKHFPTISDMRELLTFDNIVMVEDVKDGQWREYRYIGDNRIGCVHIYDSLEEL